MLIGIDCRAASHPRRGGMKTYTENLVNALVRIDNSNHYILYFDRPYEPIVDFPPNFAQKIVEGTPRIIGAGLREQWRLPRQARFDDLSILHSLCNTTSFHSKMPCVVTLHDVISISNPHMNYGFSFASIVLRLIGLYSKAAVPISARRASAIITVSNFEKEQIIKCLDIPPNKIHVTHLAPSVKFKPFNPTDQPVIKSRLAKEFNIEWPYLLAVGFEPRKNIEAIMQAMSVLPQAIKDKLGLVIVCANAEIAPAIKTRCEQFRINKFNVVSGLDDEKLRSLYSQAIALVFPSFREGFGLPPLEAMACGTPVISANTSSLPEVLGQAAFFIDPSDIKSITEAIEVVLLNSGLRASLIERGFKQVKSYSWEKTAEKTLAVYHSVYG